MRYVRWRVSQARTIEAAQKHLEKSRVKIAKAGARGDLQDLPWRQSAGLNQGKERLAHAWTSRRRSVPRMTASSPSSARCQQQATGEMNRKPITRKHNVRLKICIAY